MASLHLAALLIALAGGPATVDPPPRPPPRGDEVMDDPEDTARPASPARRASEPAPRRAGGDEVMDDPEDTAPRARPAPRPVVSPTPAPASETARFVPRVLVGGFFQLFTAFDVRYEGRRRGVAGDHRPSEDIWELRTRGRLHLEARFKRWAKARIEARLEHWVSCERPRTGNVFYFANGQGWVSHAEVELGEAYVDLYTGPVDLRIGQQIVTWGLNELINPNSVVNPLDLRRGLLVFDDDLRIPVLAVKAAWHFKGMKLEAVWQPFFVGHRLDVWGSDFALLGPGSSSRMGEAEAQIDGVIDPTIRPYVQPLLLATRRPRDDLSGSSAGLRFSGSRRGWDFGLQYWFGWDRTPGVSVESDFYRAALDGDLFQGGVINVGALGALIAGNPIYRARYHHGHQVGLSVGKAFEQVALRLDVAYFPDRGFLRTDRVPEPLGTGLIDLRVKYQTLLSALSVEYAYGQTLLVQVEAVHGALLDRAADDPRELMGFLTERQLALVVALVRLQLLRQTLLITLAGAVDVIHGSFVLAPTVAYKITDTWRVGLGAMVFEGGSDTLFGNWTRNDMVWADVKWSF